MKRWIDQSWKCRRRRQSSCLWWVVVFYCMTSYCECRAAMISRLIDRSIVRKLTVWSLSNICWFQLLKHDNLLLFFIFYGSKWRVLGFRTKEAFRRYYFGKFWWDIGWKYETIDGLIMNSLSKLYDMLLGCNDQSINWSIQSSFKQKCKLFGGSSFLNVRICCCSWSMMTVS